MPSSLEKVRRKRLRHEAKKHAGKRRVQGQPLPVTLISGFLGAGKTTLLQHILRGNHGLRIALIVNDIGAINVDASLIKRTHSLKQTSDKVVALQNGCICCTLRGDLLEELVRLSELEDFDYIIIESSGISEPGQVAEAFSLELSEQMASLAPPDDQGLDENMTKVLEKVTKAGGLEKFARLDTTVTVIDAFTMMNDFDTADVLSSRRDDVTPEDERTVSDLMVDQIEFANVIVLNKIDMVDEASKKKVLALIESLNHSAKVIETVRGRVDVKELVNTGLFNMELAQLSYGWLQDMHDMTWRKINGKNVITPKPETEEYNVRNFVYVRPRPFHPRRLFELVYDKFILRHDQEEEYEEEDEDEDEMADNKTEDEMTEVDNKMGDAEIEDGASTDTDPTLDEYSSSPNGRTKSTAQSTPATSPEKNEDGDDLTTPSDDVILANKRSHPVFARLFRSKGHFFLATRPWRSGDWSQAGGMLTMVGGTDWLCTLPKDHWDDVAPDVRKMILHDMEQGGEWGDRRQEVVFIGENLDIPAIEGLLDACLLNDEEFKKWEDVMRSEIDDDGKVEALEDIFEDAFPDWPEGDDHDHDEEEDEEEEEKEEYGRESSPPGSKRKLRSMREHLHGLKEVD